jgi:hypothetical protein
MRARGVGKDKRVETIELGLRPAFGSCMALCPADKRKNLRMRRGISLKRIGILAPGRGQELIKGLRSGSCKNWSVNHGATPLLPIRRGDLNAESSHRGHRIRLVRVGTGNIEASYHRILSLYENACLRQRCPLAVGVKGACEADPLGVVPAMSQRRAARRLQRQYELRGCHPVGRQPPGGVRKSKSNHSDNCANDDKPLNWRTNWGCSRFGHWNLFLAG